MLLGCTECLLISTDDTPVLIAVCGFSLVNKIVHAHGA